MRLLLRLAPPIGSVRWSGGAESRYGVEERRLPRSDRARVAGYVTVMGRERQPILMPTEVSSRVGVFDRFAGAAAMVAGPAAFFPFCALLSVVWAPPLRLLQDL